MVRHCLFLFVFLFSYSIQTFAQNENFAFSHFTTNNGLSQSNVTSILQDKYGFIWFGTKDGLNKYDGYKFTVYKNNPEDPFSISSSNIRDIVEDSLGNLWIGTWGGGLNLFDQEQEKFTRYKNSTEKNSLSNNFIHCLTEDSKGNLWIGTDGGGLNYFKKKNKTFTHYTNQKDNSASISDNTIRFLLEDHQQNIWVGTQSGGLNLFDQESGKFIRFQHDPDKPASISSNSIRAIHEDKNKQLWIGTYGAGIDHFDRESSTFKNFRHESNKPNSLSHNNALSLADDAEGRLWVGTENGGISIFNPETSSFQTFKHDEVDKTSLNSNCIYSLFKDRNGNMWAGTWSDGINFLNFKSQVFKHYRHNSAATSLSDNHVLCLFEDSKANIWVGTDGGGLNLLNKKTGGFTHFKHENNNSNSLTGNYVLAICEDDNEQIWVGTYGDGLSIFNKEKNTWKSFKREKGNPQTPSSNYTWKLLKDSKGYIWVGMCPGGINRYDPKTKSFTYFEHDKNDPSSLSHTNTRSIFEDSKGNIWVSTNGGGLNLYDEKANSFIHYKQDDNKNSISHNSVTNIFEDKLGNLWIGTDAGLDHLNRTTNQFTNFGPKDGLPNNFIFGILEDSEENLWISTNDGLIRFHPEQHTIRTFTMADGLQSNAFNMHAYLKSQSGSMYFGGSNGFNEFTPENIKEEENLDSPLMLTDFQIFNQSVPIQANSSPLQKSISQTKEITLSHQESVFSFEFASLNYSSAEKNFYAYKMEGFDKSWNHIGNKRTATYTNLDPDEYVFKVKASNNGKDWSPQEASIKLTIVPPYWQSWWFRSLTAIFLLGAVLLFYSHRINTIKEQKEKLEEQVMERTKEVVQQKEELEKQKEAIMAEHEAAENARKEAEKANKAKSVFLATMSHEIRTPMNGVLGMASLLAETPLKADQLEYVNILRSSGNNLLNVINDILDFSKIESGNLELEEHDFNIHHLLEEVMDLFSGKAAQRGLELIYQINPQIPAYIKGDSHRLRQVLINLVGNALKFTEKGEIFVGVELLKQHNNHLEIYFQVQDTGIGIQEEKRSRLFKSFSQVDSSTTRKYGGTGLGLAISERLVALMGGTVKVKSEVNKGTTFSFVIKSKACPAVQQEVHFDEVCLKGKKVLIIDDNQTNLRILQAYAEQWQLSAELCPSGEQALQILARQKDFDLVITDMQMPEMDGAQLSRAIKEQIPDLPIILLSSIGDENSAKHSQLFCATLSKPVKPQQLKKIIQEQFLEIPAIAEEQEQPKKLLSKEFAKEYPLQILIAEDHPVNQLMAEMLLSELGYQTQLAENGLEVLDSVTKASFDVILMDVQMPEMDGLKATEHIRKQKQPQPVIIAMTANAMKEDREVCLKAGMDDYISKPIQVELLTQALKKACLQVKAKQ